LIKDGSLNGNFVVMLKISEVAFEDGSTWTDAGKVGS
jgi:hypothetical protein